MTNDHDLRDFEICMLSGSLRDLAEHQEIPNLKHILLRSATIIELLAISRARYETLRLCDPRSFGELYAQNLAGRRFDDLVDELIAKQPM